MNTTLSTYDDLWQQMGEAHRELCRTWVEDEGMDPNNIWKIELLNEGLVRVHCYKLNDLGHRYAHGGAVAVFNFEHAVSTPPPWLTW